MSVYEGFCNVTKPDAGWRTLEWRLIPIPYYPPPSKHQRQYKIKPRQATRKLWASISTYKSVDGRHFAVYAIDFKDPTYPPALQLHAGEYDLLETGRARVEVTWHPDYERCNVRMPLGSQIRGAWADKYGDACGAAIEKFRHFQPRTAPSFVEECASGQYVFYVQI